MLQIHKPCVVYVGARLLISTQAIAQCGVRHVVHYYTMVEHPYIHVLRMCVLIVYTCACRNVHVFHISEFFTYPNWKMLLAHRSSDNRGCTVCFFESHHTCNHIHYNLGPIRTISIFMLHAISICMLHVFIRTDRQRLLKAHKTY